MSQSDAFEHAGQGLPGLDPQTARRPYPRRRQRLHQGAVATVWDFAMPPDDGSLQGESSTDQILLPYHGMYGYAVGRRRSVLDPSRVQFVPGGVEYADRFIAGQGHASLVVLMPRAVVEELNRSCGWDFDRAAEDFTRAAGPAVQLATSRLRRLGREGADGLYAEELVLSALGSVFGAPASVPACEAPRVVDRAKCVMHDRGPERITLGEIAAEVGVTPIYLTQAFKRSEGMPLYQYQLQLRLNRALLELPRCEDITDLALSLGFCSHSHFTNTFRRVFGLSPAAYRTAERAPARPGRR